jgi:hypothetical protein
MGGKTLRFPKRAKYRPYTKKSEDSINEEKISEEEHKDRLKKLKEIGLIKDG